MRGLIVAAFMFGLIVGGLFMGRLGYIAGQLHVYQGKRICELKTKPTMETHWECRDAE